jgi:hypothetical protein
MIRPPPLSDARATLADRLIRETLRPHSQLRLIIRRPLSDLRAAVLAAKRFVLDVRMSMFLADLQQVPFAVAGVRRPQVLDIIRHGALLPHPKVWIEFSGKAFRQRVLEMDGRLSPQPTDPWGNKLAAEGEVPSDWGWLLEQHPLLPTVVTMTEFAGDDGDTNGGAPMAVPFSFVWNTQDLPLPFNDVDIIAGSLAHGIMGYHCPYIGVRLDRPVHDYIKKHRIDIKTQQAENVSVLTTTHFLVPELAGVVRYALTLLSTLNDIPVLKNEVRPQRGYIARGSHRRFVDHTVIRLNVPTRRNTRMLARRVFAQSRRRYHEVRGHWRNYLRHAGIVCDNGQHKWGAPDDAGHARCRDCAAWRVWIKEHGRGDASLGVVSHSYAVGHQPLGRS